MRILIVDDSSTIRKIIKKTLNELGFNDIVEAEHGLDALKKLNGVNIIFLDWNMPVMNGLQFTRALRANKDMNNVPIVMVTTEGGEAQQAEAMKEGVNLYLIKPFSKDKLLEKIKEVAKTRKK